MIFPVGIIALIFKRHIRPFYRRARMGAVVCVSLVLAGMAFCILANYITNIWVNFLHGIEFPVSSPPSEPVESGWLGLLLAVLTTAVLPGIIEELIFRGYILNALRPFGDGVAVFCSALLFGLLHGNMVQIPFAFMLGLVFGYIVVKTGNILIPMVIHFLNNAYSTVLYQLNNDPFFKLNNSDGVGFVIVVFILLTGGTALVILLAGRHFTTRPVMSAQAALTRGEKEKLLYGSPTVIVALSLMGVLIIMGIMQAADGGSETVNALLRVI